MTALESKEMYVSQISTVQALMRFGYKCLPQAEAEKRRGKLRNVLLEDVLAERIIALNAFTYRGAEHRFTQGDAEGAILRLKLSPVEQRGLLGTNQDIYDLLVLGTTIGKTIDGDRKSYSLKYIDWERPENNLFHVTVEMSVERVGSTNTRRCDVVLFVNGIPFVVMENKASTVSVEQGVWQLIGYQQAEEVPHLFHFAQVLIAANKNEVRYATVGSSKKFWLTWHDEDENDEDIHRLVNIPLTEPENAALFSGDFAVARPYFEEMEAAGERAVTEQDRILFALCRPERLLDLVRVFTVFEAGVRKIARYQQFFGVRRMMARLRRTDAADGRRTGGVIWATQGSGKSLTMVMLGKALAFARDIPAPRIVIVTDREDLEQQIKETFKACEMEPKRAGSGHHLLRLLAGGNNLITTIVNKFDTATRNERFADPDTNVFVLVDESHRSQYGTFAVKMRRILPNACYIGFTGTPLLKTEKNTLAKFGGIIRAYTIAEAVKDGAVVPLLYEGRYVEQNLSGGRIDTWFEKLSQGLNDNQKADLKSKVSRMDVFSRTEQAIYAKALDISEHYRQHWQGTGFKAQLVVPSKAAAIRFKEVLDEIGHVTSEIIISAPDEREGNDEVDRESTDRVRRFWTAMMARYGNEEEYNRQIVEAFLGPGDPEILIVVSKLLTGFNAPRNTILYVCKQMKDHNLLQAIARVNRVFEENGTHKEFGFIIDYEGLLGKLDLALTEYTALAGYDGEDLTAAVSDVRGEIGQLSQLHRNVWSLFKEVRNKLDHEQMEQHLADDKRREEFYARLRDFGRCLHVALASEKTYDVYSDDEVDRFKRDWKSLTRLRQSVQIRYQEVIDIKEYEPKIQKLLDDHVIADPAQVIIDLVNINDPGALRRILQDDQATDASKADRIASATKKTINERMDEDPALYKKFSEMLKEVIDAYRQQRIAEKDYLGRVTEIAKEVAKGRREEGVPESIRGNADAQAFFGVLEPVTTHHLGEGEEARGGAAHIARDVLDVIREHLIVNLWENDDAQNAMCNAIDDYFFDTVGPEMGVHLTPDELDAVEQALMSVAKARFAL